MTYITTTDLRTQSPLLIQSLKKGFSVSLIHRSTVVGVISPVESASKPIADISDFSVFLGKIKPAKLLNKAGRERKYKQYLKLRYGKNLPRH